MRTTLGLALLAGFLMVAGAAAAQDNESDANESQNAWVEDCPPDMMCAMSAPSEEGGETEPACEADCPQKEPTSDENATYSGDCGGEVCAYSDPGKPVSSDDEPKSDGSTCMDGADEGEDCPDDRYYTMAPGSDGAGEPEPSTESSKADDAQDADAAKRAVPAAGVVAFAGALGAALALVAPTRRK